jgi:transcription initiation factor TFIIIB Brf1 subunit/transcription initiation factor TFIIB
VEVRDRCVHWIAKYSLRNYGVRPRDIPQLLNKELDKYNPLKQKVFNYMENCPIARPKEVLNNFEGQNRETIGKYVKKWKKNNYYKITKYTNTLAIQYLTEIGLENNIRELSIQILERFLSTTKPSLKSEWKGIIAGAIYLATKLSDHQITQATIANHIGIDSNTLSKRYREIAHALSINL